MLKKFALLAGTLSVVPVNRRVRFLRAPITMPSTRSTKAGVALRISQHPGALEPSRMLKFLKASTWPVTAHFWLTPQDGPLTCLVLPIATFCPEQVILEVR